MPPQIKLSQEDINAIVGAVVSSLQAAGKPSHECRFSDIEVEDMRETVNFVKNFNRAMADSRTIVRRFFLVSALTGVSGYLVAGGWSTLIAAIRRHLGQP